MARMIELAERCEKATQDDRELDAEIAASVRYHPYGPTHWLGGADIEIRATGTCVQAFRSTGESCDNYQPQPYTSSIDASMTLPPGDLWLTLDRYVVSDQPEPNIRTWRVWLKGLVGDIEGDGPCSRVEYFATGATPALAIAAASLKARAALQEAVR